MDAQRAVAWRSGGPNVASVQNGSRGAGTVSTQEIWALAELRWVEPLSSFR